jgi:hypothetical protein
MAIIWKAATVLQHVNAHAHCSKIPPMPPATHGINAFRKILIVLKLSVRTQVFQIRDPLYLDESTAGAKVFRPPLARDLSLAGLIID